MTSNRALARQLGVSETAVRQAEKAGRIRRETDGSWDPAKVKAAWARNTDQTQQRPARSGGQTGKHRALKPVPEAAVGAVRDKLHEHGDPRAPIRHITSWTGVELEGGPAPLTPDNVAAVMELYPVGERFFQEFTLRQILLNAAKTDQGPLPLALPAGRRARILPSLPRGRPAVRRGGGEPTDGSRPKRRRSSGARSSSSREPCSRSSRRSRRASGIWTRAARSSSGLGRRPSSTRPRSRS